MADFRNLQTKIKNLDDAENLLAVFRIMYQDAKVVSSLLARYQADPAFKTAVDFVFAQDQRAELAGMIAAVNTLLSDWESNHPSVLGQDVEMI